MIHVAPELYFDFVDPISYLLFREIDALDLDDGPDPVHGLVWTAFELAPPPMSVTTPEDPSWRDRWALAGRLATETGVPLVSPALIPWSRKAHELHEHAKNESRGAAIRSALFEAFFVDGRDIGRVDVLVDVARACGLDATTAKAVLDVDRYTDSIATSRETAAGAGIDTVPVLRAEGRRLQGFHNRAALSTFLSRT